MSVPGPPVINTLPLAQDKTLKFQWRPPLSDGGLGIDGYLLRLNNDDSGTLISPAARFYSTGPTLTNGTTYFPFIQASNSAGLGPASYFRPFQPGTTKPNPPSTALAETVGLSSIMVSWTPPAILPDAPIQWYTIFSQSTNPSDTIFKLSADANLQTNYFIPSVNPESRYYFTINAANSIGRSLPISTNTVGFIPVGDYVFEASFPTLSNTTGFSNYDSNRLMVNSPTGSGFSYLTTYNYTGSNSLYKSFTPATTNTVSFTCSIYRTATVGWCGLIMQRPPASGFNMISSGLNLGYIWNDAVDTYTYDTGIVIPTNEWFHVALTMTATTAKWYVNGELAHTRSGASHASVALSNMYVGVDPNDAATRSFSGYIDNVRFYTRTITDAEVYSIYKYYQAAQTTTAIPTTVAGLQVWYDGSDPLGTGTAPVSGSVVATWYDKSGNTRDANGTSSPTYTLGNYGRINLNGTNQYYTLSTSSFIANQNFTIFVVERLQGNASSLPALFGGTSGSTNANLSVLYKGTNAVNITLSYYNNDLVATNSTNAFSIAGAQPIRIWAFRQIASQRSMWVNGNPFSQDANNTLLSGWGGAQIGRFSTGNFYNGQMLDLLFYTGTISITNMQNIIAYLAQKWYVSLPSFIPIKLPTVQAWYDTTDANTITLSGSNLTQLRDKSGRGAHMNVGAGTIPYGADGGFNVVTLSTNNYLSSAITINVQNNVTAYFYVAKLYSPFIFGFGMLLSASNLRVTYSATTGQIQGGPDVGADAGQMGGNTYYINGSRNATNINTYNTYHLVRFVQANLGTSPTTQTLRLANVSQGANIKYGEIIVIQGTAAQINLNIERVEGYLAWKWGINSLLPSTHTYYSVAPKF
jgi:hypothetical protein